MDGVNNNSETVQQQNSVVSSGLSLMNAYRNRHQIIMIPTPGIIYTSEVMQPVQSIVVTDTSTLHQTNMQSNPNSVVSTPIISSSSPAVSNANSIVSTPIISSSPPVVSNPNSIVSFPDMQSNPYPVVSTAIISSSPPVVSNPNSVVSTPIISSSPPVVRNPNPIVSSPVISSYPPAVSNSQVLTSRTHGNQITSLPLGAQDIRVSNQTLHLSNTRQNLSSAFFNPYAEQRLASNSYATQLDTQVNSTSWRPDANMSNVLSTGNHGAMSGGSINQQQNYVVGTCNNDNGTTMAANAISTPTNTQMTTGSSSFSPAVAPTALVCPPTVRAPPQQGMVQTNAIRQPPMRPKVPSIYVQQLQKYIIRWGQRPRDNNIIFWRQFVADFFAPDGKKKICLSSCQENSTSKYRRSKEKPLCDICKAYSQTGHEISFEELPIFFQTRFNSKKDDKLNLYTFVERNLGNNSIVLYFPMVIEQVLDDNSLTIQKGPLAVTFNSNKKILSWQFCMRSCEKLPPPTLVPRVNGTSGNSSGASRSNSEQQRTQAHGPRNVNMGQQLVNNLAASTHVAQTNMINGHPNAMRNSMDFNSRNQHQIGYMQNCTAQQTLSGTIAGANYNFSMQNLPTVLDTSASLTNTISPLINPNVITNPLHTTPTVNTVSLPGQSGPTNTLKRSGATENALHMNAPEQHVTNMISPLVNPNVITNPLYATPTINTGSLSGQSGPTNTLKRSGTTENALHMNAPEQCVTRQRLEGAFSGNGAEKGNGNRNLALINPNVITNPLHTTPTVNTVSLPGQSGPTNTLKRSGATENALHMNAPEQHVTNMISPLVNPNVITNPLYATPTINTGSLSGQSGPTNTLKRSGTTENALHMNAPEQCVTRQRLEGAFSGNGAEMGNGNRNLALTTGLTQGLASDNNIGSTANSVHGSTGVLNITEQQLDQFFDNFDPENDISDLLNFFINQ